MKITEIIMPRSESLNEGMLSAFFKKDAAQWIKLLIKLGISAAPIWKYNQNIKEYEKKYKSGEWTKAQFDEVRRSELTIVVERIAAGLLGSKLIGSMASVLSFAKIPQLFPKMYYLIYSLSVAGQLKFIEWINSEEGRTWLSYLITDKFIDISPLVGGGTAALLDKLESLIPGFEGIPQTVNKTPTQPTPSTALTAPQKQPDQSAALTAPQKQPRGDDINWALQKSAAGQPFNVYLK